MRKTVMRGTGTVGGFFPSPKKNRRSWNGRWDVIAARSGLFFPLSFSFFFFYFLFSFSILFFYFLFSSRSRRHVVLGDSWRITRAARYYRMEGEVEGGGGGGRAWGYQYSETSGIPDIRTEEPRRAACYIRAGNTPGHIRDWRALSRRLIPFQWGYVYLSPSNAVQTRTSPSICISPYNLLRKYLPQSVFFPTISFANAAKSLFSSTFS